MRIFLLTGDLLFPSRLQAALGAVGHQVLVGASIVAAPLGEVDLVVADLTMDGPERVEALASLASRPPVLAFYSHVDAELRDAAVAAGLERVVPRSRMAREPVALVESAAGGSAPPTES